MTDYTAIRTALTAYTKWNEGEGEFFPPPGMMTTQILADAAAVLIEVIDNSRALEWCEVGEAPATRESYLTKCSVDHLGPCTLRPKLLIDAKVAA